MPELATGTTAGQRTAAQAPAPLRLELLRGFVLRTGEEALELPHAAQRLVAFLALRDRPVHRLVVSGALWTDHGPDQASASLRTALWRTNRVADGLVCSAGTSLQLATEVGVDVRQAERRAELLTRAPEEHCPRDLLLLGETGELLPDWYEDWVIVERERYRQVRLHALEALCRALAAAGQHAEAVAAGLAAVAAEPLRESGHRTLMAAHVAEGNVTEALRQYEAFRRRLAEDVGLEPSPRMRMMVARLRSS